MSPSQKIIDEALSLPVEERAFIADSLLKSPNRPDPEIDKNWIEVARRRKSKIHSGR